MKQHEKQDKRKKSVHPQCESSVGLRPPFDTHCGWIMKCRCNHTIKTILKSGHLILQFIFFYLRNKYVAIYKKNCYNNDIFFNIGGFF